MASVASKRKVEGIEVKHKELGEKLQELLRLHKDIATDLVAWIAIAVISLMNLSIASGRHTFTGMVLLMIHDYNVM